MASKKSSYARASRDIAVSYVFIIPLLMLYEAMVLFDPAVRNGTDPILKGLFQSFGSVGMIVFELLFLALLCFSLARAQKVRTGRPDIYGRMFAESVVWALVLFAMAQFWLLLPLSIPPLISGIAASAGAGVYEEVIFRFVILGGLLWIFRRPLGAAPWLAVTLALAVSSGLFSWAHHAIGGEAWNSTLFSYRAFMGALLGGLYLVRGLGVTVYTHALYNILLTLIHHFSNG